MTPLPGLLRTLPLAHRGLHDPGAGIAENSLAAVRAAMDAGYGIELDLQPSQDGVAMVFHDDDLDRLTAATGPVRARHAAELSALPLTGDPGTIPRFAEVLALVAGAVPLLVEIKSQPGDPRTATLPLVEAALADLAGYAGPLALMSFNPFAVAHGARLRPDLAWGVTTGHGEPLWPDDPDLDRRLIQSAIDPRDWGGSFVSHGLWDAGAPWLPALAAAGVDILSWTIRSPADEARARRYAGNITFEGYRPARPSEPAAYQGERVDRASQPPLPLDRCGAETT